MLEQLMTPSPLRQRRFRKEQRSLGNDESAAETAAGEDGDIEGIA